MSKTSPYSTYFKEWILENYLPCAVVYSTDKAKKIIAKNNMTPAEILRPITDFTGKRIEYNISENFNEPNKVLKNFKLDLYDNDKFVPVPKDKYNDYILIMFEQNAPIWNLNSPVITKKNIDPFLNKLRFLSLPWFSEFERLILEFSRFSEIELFQQPLLSVLVCDIKEEATVLDKELFKSPNVPKLIYDGKYEIIKIFLIILLWDVSELGEGNEEEKKNLEEAYRKMYVNKKYYFIVWEINKKGTKSNNNNNKKINDDIWRQYLHKIDLYNPNDNRLRRDDISLGQLIDDQEIIDMRKKVYDYFSKVYFKILYDHLKESYQFLKSIGGIKNLFSKLRKNEEKEFYQGTRLYKFTKLERIYFKLGVLHFYFQNYETAVDYLSNFKNALKDKSDQHKYSAKQLASICKFIINTNNGNKNAFQIIDELVFKGHKEEAIKVELIKIKMLESLEEFEKLRVNIFEFYGMIDKLRISAYITSVDYFQALSYEKIASYEINDGNFRKFCFYMFSSGKRYNLIEKKIMKRYALYDFSCLMGVCDDPSFSFYKYRLQINKKLGEICNELGLYDCAFKFYRNCLEYSVQLSKNSERTINEKIGTKNKNKDGIRKMVLDKIVEEQSLVLNSYLQCFNKLKNNKMILNPSIDLNSLSIPEVSNASLFLIEQKDVEIIKTLKDFRSRTKYSNEKSFKVFEKYTESLHSNPYQSLDENDVNKLNILNDYIIDDKNMGHSNKIRVFKGNPNQKLYVRFKITNPLNIRLNITSAKLLCKYIANKGKDKDKEKIEEEKNCISTSTEKEFIVESLNFELRELEKKNIEITLEPLFPGLIIVKGIIFALCNNCEIIHLFNKKSKYRLYSYRHKNLLQIDSSVRMNSTSSKESEISSNEGSRTSSVNSIHSLGLYKPNNKLSKKQKIEYLVMDKNKSFQVNFPIGQEIKAYKYQLIYFPIIVANYTKNHRVKRYSIFIESSSENKIKSFFKYLTRNVELNEENREDLVYLPILPKEKGESFIKMIIKFADEVRKKPIEIERFVIKFKVKDSVQIDSEDKYLNYYDQNNYEFECKINIKNNIYLGNLKNSNMNEIINKDNQNNIVNNVYDIEMKTPLTINCIQIGEDQLLDRTEYYINKRYTFKKTKTNRKESIIPSYKFSDILNINNFEYKKYKTEEEIKDNSINNIIENTKEKALSFENYIQQNQTHLINVFSNSLKNLNKSIILPFTINIDGKKIFFLYELELQLNLLNKKLTYEFFRSLLYNSVKSEIKQHKMNDKETLINISIDFNKKAFYFLENFCDKYEIFGFYNKKIRWISNSLYRIENKPSTTKEKDEDYDKLSLSFNYITKVKGTWEANLIGAKFYLTKTYLLNQNIAKEKNTIIVNHIYKPEYIEIE